MRLFGLLGLFLGLVISWPAFAYVSSSNSYRLDSDSLNSAGATSTSASYGVADTMGETATGEVTSTSYKLQAGYQYMAAGPLALSSPGDVTMGPTISASGGGQANGQLIWRIVSNGGFNFYLRSGGGDGGKTGLRSTVGAFSNYSGITLTWLPASSTPTFGFNPFGTYAYADYLSRGGFNIADPVTGPCGFGFGLNTSNDGYCWDGFTDTNKLVAQSNTGPTDDTVTVNLRADYQLPVAGRLAPGDYQASLTSTLLGI